MHVLAPPGDSVAGAQLMDAGATGAVVLMVKLALPPFKAAVIVVD